MATEKTTADFRPADAGRRRSAGKGDLPAIPARQIDLVSLEIEDDDAGGDPYNRTGQFCLAALRNLEQ